MTSDRRTAPEDPNTPDMHIETVNKEINIPNVEEEYGFKRFRKTPPTANP